MQKLESDLNIQILDRTGHRARFTRTGQMLLEKGRDVLHTVRELEKQAVKLHRGWENELVIGVDDTFPFSLLTRLLRRSISATASPGWFLSMACWAVLGGPDAGQGGYHRWGAA